MRCSATRRTRAASARRSTTAATAAREIEQADDLGAAARIDVDDQRRDVREHEVEAEAGARIVGVRAAAVVARAADVIDDVALADRAEPVVDRDRDLAPSLPQRSSARLHRADRPAVRARAPAATRAGHRCSAFISSSSTTFARRWTIGRRAPIASAHAQISAIAARLRRRR